MRQPIGSATLLAALTGAASLAGVLAPGHDTVPRTTGASAPAMTTAGPAQVVGSGSAASCTSAAVVRAVAAGGRITFNCGSRPVTIEMTATAKVANTAHQVILDGGGKVTLSGGGKHQILNLDTCAGVRSAHDCVDQPYPQLTVQDITLEDGYNGTRQQAGGTGPDTWYGGVNGGGAIYAEGGQFSAVNSQFISNRCYPDGPDLGGGAIRALAQYQNRPVYLSHDTFRGNTCSNGGALSSIDVQWTISDSVFTGNKAVGTGANPARRGTPGGGSGGAIYADGQDCNVLISGTTMTGNQANEGGGAIFYVVNSGWGNLTLTGSHLSDNPSLGFQDYPGIFDRINNRDRKPVMIGSTDS